MSFPRQHLLSAALATAFGTVVTTWASGAAAQAPAPAAAQVFDVRLAAQPLAAALNELSRQTGAQVLAAGEVVAGVSAPTVSGRLTLQQALDALLASSGLVAVRNGPSQVTIQRAPAASGNTLSAVTVQAAADGTTEGTGAYATRSTDVATRMGLALRETPQSVSVITRQQMDDQNLTTLNDVLRQTPGIVVDRLDERVKFTSRGFELSKMVDGVPTLSFNSAAGEASLASTVIYDRVEVIRGAAGLLNGVGDPGGAINLVRKRPTTDFAGSISLGAGSWSRYNTEVDLGGKLNEAGTLRGRVVGSFTDGKSFIDDKKQREEVFYSIVEADIARDTTLAVGYERQKTAIKGANFGQAPLFYGDGTLTDLPRSFNSSAPWSRWDMTTDRLFLNLEHRAANGWKIKAEASYTENQRDRIGGDIWLWPGSVDRLTGETVIDRGNNPAKGINKALDVYATGPFDLLGRTHQASVGFNINRYNYWVYGSNSVPGGTDQVPVNINQLRWTTQPAFVYPAFQFGEEIEEKAIYGSTRLRPTDKLSVLLGGRMSWYKNNGWQGNVTDPLSAARTWGTPVKESRVFTPYAGIVYDLSKEYSVYASYTDIFQANTARDSGNNVLDPRRGKNLELGIKGEHLDGKLNTAFAIFETKEDNVPVVDEGALPLPDGTIPSRAVKGARSKGFEFTAAGELAPGWQILGGYTYHAKRDADHKLLNTTYPRRLLRIATSYRLPGAWNKLTVGGSIAYQSGIHFDEYYGLGTVTQGGLTLIGLMARYEFSKQLSGSLNIENLSDKRYYTGLGGYNGYTYGAPRNVWVKLNYKF